MRKYKNVYLLKRQVVIIIFLFYMLRSFAELPHEPLNYFSPNAVDLGQYGDVPVNLFTGIPQIGIPLYNYKYREISVPIALNYYAGGVRPDQHPGWVGVNWSLTAGGCIRRLVNDMPDDYRNSHFKVFSGSFFRFTPAYSKTQMNWVVKRDSNYCIYYDTEPDEFSFQFAEYSGKFYYNPSIQEWIAQCNKPIRITLNDGFMSVPDGYLKGHFQKKYGNTTSFSGFTITTENGVQYVFGNTKNAIEYSMGFFTQDNDEWIAGTWYLTKIKHPNGYCVDFSYVRGDYINQMYYSINNHLGSYAMSIDSYGLFNDEHERMKDVLFTIRPVDYSTYADEELCRRPMEWEPDIRSYCNGKLIAPVYLTSIKSKSGEVVFTSSTTNELRYDPHIYECKYNAFKAWQDQVHNYNSQTDRYNPFCVTLDESYYTSFLPFLSNPGSDYSSTILDKLKWRKLDAIVVRNSLCESVKRFVLTYNNVSTERLFLLSVTEKDIHNVLGAMYQLEYKDRDKLPPYMSNKTDHWGFFNNKYAQPNHTKYYEYKEPDSSKVSYGVLKKIVYPTGGTSEFVFEANDYSKVVKERRWEGCNDLDRTKIAGGVRIKRITTKSDEKTPPQIKTYSYRFGGQSSGILGHQNRYYYDDYLVRSFDYPELYFAKMFFFSQSVLPGYNGGPPVGYSCVSETNDDGSSIVYFFSNYDNKRYLDEKPDATIFPDAMVYNKYNSKEQERGLLLSKEYYTRDNRITFGESYYYRKVYAQLYQMALQANCGNICSENYDDVSFDPSYVSYAESTLYKIYTYSMSPWYVTTVRYSEDRGKAVVTEKAYEYEYCQVESEQTYTDDGVQDSCIVFRRPRVVDSGAYEQMVQNNQISAPIETITYSIRDEIAYVSSAKLCTYKYFPNVNNCLPYQYFEAEIAGEWIRKSRFILYDGHKKDNHYGKPLFTIHRYTSQGCVQEVEDRSGMRTVYLWGYYQQYPFMKITNATYNEVVTALSKYNLKIDGQENAPTPCNSVGYRKAVEEILPNAHVTTLVYKPSVGITSVIDPRGMVTWYEYDDFGRLERVKDNENNLLKLYMYHYSDEVEWELEE